VRFTFTSLGIAVLAPLVQSRASTHIRDLSFQFKPVSHAALTLIRQQGLDLAVHDAFWLSLVAFALALIAVSCIRVPKPASQVKNVNDELAVQQVRE
jgi:hypothetical protein